MLEAPGAPRRLSRRAQTEHLEAPPTLLTDRSQGLGGEHPHRSADQQGTTSTGSQNPPAGRELQTRRSFLRPNAQLSRQGTLEVSPESRRASVVDDGPDSRSAFGERESAGDAEGGISGRAGSPPARRTLRSTSRSRIWDDVQEGNNLLKTFLEPAGGKGAFSVGLAKASSHTQLEKIFHHGGSVLDNIHAVVNEVNQVNNENPHSVRAFVAKKKLLMWLFLEEPFLTPLSTAYSLLMILLVFCGFYTAVAPQAFNNFSGEFHPTPHFESRVYWFTFAVNLICTLETGVRFFVAPVKTNVFGCVLWLVKLCRYFPGWYLLRMALRNSMSALLIPVFFLTMMGVAGASLITTFDWIAAVNGDAPFTISSWMNAFHYIMVVTISIDVSPVYGTAAQSGPAQAITVLWMYLGVIFLSMPIAIVGTCFSQTWFDQDRIVLVEKVRSRMRQQGYTTDDLREVFDEVDEDLSGEIDFYEFKRMLEAFHFFAPIGKTRKLFNHFDSNGIRRDQRWEEFVCVIFPEITDIVDWDGDVRADVDGDALQAIAEEDSEDVSDSSSRPSSEFTSSRSGSASTGSGSGGFSRDNNSEEGSSKSRSRSEESAGAGKTKKGIKAKAGAHGGPARAAQKKPKKRSRSSSADGLPSGGDSDSSGPARLSIPGLISKGKVIKVASAAGAEEGANSGGAGAQQQLQIEQDTSKAEPEPEGEDAVVNVGANDARSASNINRDSGDKDEDIHGGSGEKDDNPNSGLHDNSAQLVDGPIGGSSPSEIPRPPPVPGLTATVVAAVVTLGPNDEELLGQNIVVDKGVLRRTRSTDHAGAGSLTLGSNNRRSGPGSSPPPKGSALAAMASGGRSPIPRRSVEREREQTPRVIAKAREDAEIAAHLTQSQAAVKARSPAGAATGLLKSIFSRSSAHKEPARPPELTTTSKLGVLTGKATSPVEGSLRQSGGMTNRSSQPGGDQVRDHSARSIHDDDHLHANAPMTHKRSGGGTASRPAAARTKSGKKSGKVKALTGGFGTPGAGGTSSQPMLGGPAAGASQSLGLGSGTNASGRFAGKNKTAGGGNGVGGSGQNIRGMGGGSGAGGNFGGGAGGSYNFSAGGSSSGMGMGAQDQSVQSVLLRVTGRVVNLENQLNAICDAQKHRTSIISSAEYYHGIGMIGGGGGGQGGGGGGGGQAGESSTWFRRMSKLELLTGTSAAATGSATLGGRRGSSANANRENGTASTSSSNFLSEIVVDPGGQRSGSKTSNRSNRGGNCRSANRAGNNYPNNAHDNDDEYDFLPGSAVGSVALGGTIVDSSGKTLSVGSAAGGSGGASERLRRRSSGGSKAKTDRADRERADHQHLHKKLRINTEFSVEENASREHSVALSQSVAQTPSVVSEGAAPRADVDVAPGVAEIPPEEAVPEPETSPEQ
eukprot:g6686.t1